MCRATADRRHRQMDRRPSRSGRSLVRSLDVRRSVRIHSPANSTGSSGMRPVSDASSSSKNGWRVISDDDLPDYRRGGPFRSAFFMSCGLSRLVWGDEMPTSRLKPRRQGGPSFSGTHNRDDLEIGDVLPVCHPLIEQATIVTFHYLEAALQILGDPTATVLDSIRHQSSLISETAIHRNGVAVAKVLDDHVQNGCFTFRRPSCTRRRLAPRRRHFKKGHRGAGSPR